MDSRLWSNILNLVEQVRYMPHVWLLRCLFGDFCVGIQGCCFLSLQSCQYGVSMSCLVRSQHQGILLTLHSWVYGLWVSSWTWLAISSYVLEECCISQGGMTFPTTSPIPIVSGGHLGGSGSLCLIVSLCILHSHQQKVSNWIERW